MNHEISELDISGIQLRESKTQPKVSHSREIGEAQIVHTIFGKAKVRIIRKHDKFRRALWLTAAFGVAATSTVVLQNWYATRQTESVQSADPLPPPAHAAVYESAPPARTENVVTPDIPPAAVTEPAKPAPATGSKTVPHPQAAMKPVEKEAVPPVPHKPATIPPKPAMAQPKPAMVQPKPSAAAIPGASQPAVTGKPSTPPVATVSTAVTPQTSAPAAKPLPPKPSAPAAMTTPAAKTVAPASSPAAAPALAAPLVKEDASAPVAEKQLASPVSVPGY